MRLSWKILFFYRRLSPLAHLGPFSYFGFKTTSQLSVEIFFLIDAIANSPIFAYSLISDSKRHHNSLLEFFFVIDALAHSPISAHSLISLMTEKWWEKTFQEVERSKFKKSEKMMRKDVLGGQRSKLKNPKKWWEKTFRRWRGPKSKNPKKWWEKTFHEVKGQSSKNPFLVDALKNEENKGNNDAMRLSWKVLFFIDA